jgi:hypothetical protein
MRKPLKKVGYKEMKKEIEKVFAQIEECERDEKRKTPMYRYAKMLQERYLEYNGGEKFVPLVKYERMLKKLKSTRWKIRKYYRNRIKCEVIPFPIRHKRRP